MYKREGKPEIVLITGYTDFRCGINALTALLTSKGLADAVYVFCRKGRSSVKLLYWGGSGFWLIQYRLEKGKVAWLKENGAADITYRQMEWLLDGLDIEQKHYVGEVKERLLT